MWKHSEGKSDLVPTPFPVLSSSLAEILYGERLRYRLSLPSLLFLLRWSGSKEGKPPNAKYSSESFRSLLMADEVIGHGTLVQLPRQPLVCVFHGFSSWMGQCLTKTQFLEVGTPFWIDILKRRLWEEGTVEQFIHLWINLEEVCQVSKCFPFSVVWRMPETYLPSYFTSGKQELTTWTTC